MGIFFGSFLQFLTRFGLPPLNFHLFRRDYAFSSFGMIKTPVTQPANDAWITEEIEDGYTVFRHNGTIKICLNHPEQCNALTATMVEGITRLFKTLSADSSIYRIIVTGHGRYFCTGIQLTEDLFASVPERSTALRDLFNSIDTCPKITVALINGPAFGGGVGLATVCDVRLALSESFFCLSEVKLGLCPAIISKVLVREWGASLARMAMMTGRKVQAQILYNTGAIHALAPDLESLEKTAEEFLSDTKLAAPRAAASCKTLVREAAGSGDMDGLIGEVFEDMLDQGSESEYGILQFRNGIRGVVWEDIARKKQH